ncbi:hypothetical protein MTR_2g033243 [Medicago truncatula]|uniref:Uncharacterized protein n=1 Tax=Medicago truncatula TaxID=3880 RepID=A0A072V6Z8_MEDTR|nr:hypothetical protein MTR_2g033243 [Medicago truncatula]
MKMKRLAKLKTRKGGLGKNEHPAGLKTRKGSPGKNGALKRIYFPDAMSTTYPALKCPAQRHFPQSGLPRFYLQQVAYLPALGHGSDTSPNDVISIEDLRECVT